MNSTRTIALTSAAMVAFAANSVLCRLALGSSSIDPASFSTVRVVSGAVTLVGLAWIRQPQVALTLRRPDYASAVALALYALPFSFAYVELSTGTGALILFACVQLTMLLGALRGGERPHPLQWAGLCAALGGLVYLVLPGVAAPSLAGSSLMATAGVAWGIYSLRGRRSTDPLASTACNFVWCTPLVIALSFTQLQDVSANGHGLALALASGCIASGVGYTVWYSALRTLSATRAAAIQLSVPVLAALYGALFMTEPLTLRLLLSSTLILGGVGLALLGKERHAAKDAKAKQTS